jgi:SagB-type dehydrogenase family enzyme
MMGGRRRILIVAAFAAAVVVAAAFTLRQGGKMMADTNNPGRSVKLPDPRRDSETSVEKALLKRRSLRSYAEQPLTLAQVSQILWAAQGVTEPTRGLRTAPSAGALYPLEVYVVAGKVNDLPAGIYKYVPRSHTLIRVAEGDKRSDLASAALNQSWIAEAPIILVVSAIYDRTAVKYGTRATRYVHIEVGHAAQNVCLQAVALGLGAGVVGAFDDDAVARVLSAPSSEAPLYILPVGKPAK